MHRQKVFHILNKSSTGGAESLVRELVAFSSTDKNSLNHNIFLIAKSSTAIWLFSKKGLRIIPILVASSRLIFTIILNNFKDNKAQIIYLFHLAEGHLVARLLSFVPKIFKKSIFCIYLHQSKALYPAKLLKSADLLIQKFPVICYSEVATNNWFTNLQKESVQRFIIHNIVSTKYLNLSTNRNFSQRQELHFVFVGRFVGWKHPEMAVDFSQKFANFSSINLTFIGISESEYVSKYGPIVPKTKNSLEIDFIGNSNSVEERLNNSDLFLYLSDTSLSGESIGIAAMEALCIGVPVVVQDKSKSDFFGLPGIYEYNDFFGYDVQLFTEEQNSAKSRLLNETLRLTQADIDGWRDVASIQRYNHDLKRVVDVICTTKTKDNFGNSI
jgi:glycosyltransferase involved in cell wall biosynthesis